MKGWSRSIRPQGQSLAGPTNLDMHTRGKVWLDSLGLMNSLECKGIVPSRHQCIRMLLLAKSSRRGSCFRPTFETCCPHHLVGKELLILKNYHMIYVLILLKTHVTSHLAGINWCKLSNHFPHSNHFIFPTIHAQVFPIFYIITMTGIVYSIMFSPHFCHDSYVTEWAAISWPKCQYLFTKE